MSDPLTRIEALPPMNFAIVRRGDTPRNLYATGPTAAQAWTEFLADYDPEWRSRQGGAVPHAEAAGYHCVPVEMVIKE